MSDELCVDCYSAMKKITDFGVVAIIYFMARH